MTHRHLAPQPFQVATFSAFGILLEGQTPHPGVPDFIQVQKRQEKLHGIALPVTGQHQALEPLRLQQTLRQIEWLRAQEVLVQSNSEEARKLLLIHFI